MSERMTTVLIALALLVAFGAAGRMDYQDAVADEANQVAELAKCIPRPGEVLQARWMKGRLQCETYPAGMGAMHRNTRLVEVTPAIFRPTR